MIVVVALFNAISAAKRDNENGEITEVASKVVKQPNSDGNKSFKKRNKISNGSSNTTEKAGGTDSNAPQKWSVFDSSNTSKKSIKVIHITLKSNHLCIKNSKKSLIAFIVYYFCN